ncbi:MAG: hypothetical protein LBR66_08250 [Candidatus Symbiothrix sp.]|jgi:hypothetical protein|nr:hypothetical protein [Candidatus Symbiothrix sp.]
MERKIFFTLLACLLASFAGKAQVTIGTLQLPHPGAILHLRTSTQNLPSLETDSLGMKLPVVALPDTVYLNLGDELTYDRDIDLSAMGMVVYNTTDNCSKGLMRCLYVWTGWQWRPVGCPPGCESLCTEPFCEARDARLFPADATKTVDVPTIDGGTLKFLTYNLGACPELSPKEQMAYQSPFATTWTTPSVPCVAQDAMVFGGLFQWGRSDYSHAGRCAYDPDSSPEYYLGGSLGWLYNDEIDYRNAIEADTAKIASGGTMWMYGHDYYDFWGNGEGLLGQGVTNYSGPQNRYNPCPTGFRLPTQHEWASIGFSDGQFSDISGDIWTWCDYNSLTGTWEVPDPANPGFPADGSSFEKYFEDGSLPTGSAAENNRIVWISVVDGKPSFDWDVPATLYTVYGEVENPHMCGYALYTVADWTAATGVGGYLNGVDWTTTDKRLYDRHAPEPLMFLPAAGLRSGAIEAIRNTGYTGSYWSSTVSDLGYYYAYTMQLYGNCVKFDDKPVCAAYAIESNVNNDPNANCISSARSVRCVAETPCATPIVAATMEFCRDNLPAVSDLIPAPSTAITWYNASNNTPLNAIDPLTDGGQYYCIYSDGSCSSPQSNTMTVDLVDALPTNSTISGPTVLQQGQTVTYSLSVSGDVGTAHYEWYIYRYSSGSSSGCSIVSGQGTNSITVAVAADATIGTDWYIRVYVKNPCSSTNIDEYITVLCSTTPPAAPTSGGDVINCAASSTTPFTLTATPPSGSTVVWYSSVTGGSSYIVGTGDNLNLTSGIGNDISRTYYAESVTSDGCISATRTPITATRGTPAQPGSISGPSPVCANATNLTYSVTNVPGVTYEWGLPTGWSTVSGQGTNSITVTAGSSGGTITVTPKNTTCSIAGTARTRGVTVIDVPAQPSAIGCFSPTVITDGSNDVDFWVTKVDGVTYTWEAVSYTLSTESYSIVHTDVTGWFTILKVLEAGDTHYDADHYTIRTKIDSQGLANNNDIYLTIRVTPSNGCGTGPAQEGTFSVKRGS